MISKLALTICDLRVRNFILRTVTHSLMNANLHLGKELVREVCVGQDKKYWQWQVVGYTCNRCIKWQTLGVTWLNVCGSPWWNSILSRGSSNHPSCWNQSKLLALLGHLSLYTVEGTFIDFIALFIALYYLLLASLIVSFSFLSICRIQDQSSTENER